MTNKQAEKVGISLNAKENRRFDEVFGDENSATIREHKHISGKLGTGKLAQFGDNIKIVQHNRSIKADSAQSVIIEKDVKKFRPNKLIYTFATPEGAEANKGWMYRELTKHQEYLSFEIFNIKRERKEIAFNNISQLNGGAFTKWLGLTINSSQNSP